jgi:polyhydroxyalkanoate synthesis repressor PhaR
MGEVGGERLIRRYDNRKLYDVAGRAYVTLEDLRDLVCRGQDLRVLDQKTAEDLTSLTLAQVLLEGLRSRTARIPRPLLVQLVRLASGPSGGSWPTPREAAHRARAEAERIAGGLLAQGRLSLEEALALRQDIVRSVSGLVAEAQAGLHRLLGHRPPARGARRVVSPARAPRPHKPRGGRRRKRSS